MRSSRSHCSLSGKSGSEKQGGEKKKTRKPAADRGACANSPRNNRRLEQKDQENNYLIPMSFRIRKDGRGAIPDRSLQTRAFCLSHSGKKKEKGQRRRKTGKGMHSHHKAC